MLFRSDFLDIHKAQVLLGDDGHLSFAGRVDLGCGQIEGTLSGAVRPEAVFRVLRQEPPAWLERLSLTSSPTIEARVGPCPLRLADWQIEGTRAAPGVGYRELLFRRFEAGIAWAGGVLEVTRARVDIGPNGGDEHAEGRFTWDSVTGTLGGDVTAACRVVERLRPGGLALPPRLVRDLDAAEPVRLSARLEPSPADWRRWRARLDVDWERCGYRGLPLGPIRAGVRLADAILDRVLHAAHKVELSGESLRKIEKASA